MAASFCFLNRFRFAAAAASLAIVAAFPAAGLAHAAPISIDWVTVGNAGNTADTTGYGAVNYEYRIGKYDVTIQQYAAFLNAVAKSDPYGLYHVSMASASVGGILQAGSSGSYTYSVIGSSGNKPITLVSWFDAARFANWMQNGQGAGDTETGAYTLNGATSGNAVAKNPGAAFFIPTTNEWYKAAYFSPVKGGASSPGYYAYATRSDSAPGNVVGGGTNQANYYTGEGFSVTQSPDFSFIQNYLTDVGAFTNSSSYYGTFDQSGNVWQWNDLDGVDSIFRGTRGGGWYPNTLAFMLSSSYGSSKEAVFEANDTGFRLAATAVPEPSTYAMTLAGLACGGYSMWRRRRLA